VLTAHVEDADTLVRHELGVSVGRRRVDIEQAKGVHSQRSRISVEQAFGRRRTYARNNNARLAVVAGLIGTRKLDPAALDAGHGGPPRSCDLLNR
jgi:hypothetical protein